jgi:MFS superfamily sulfate permease-like transporter
MQEAFALGVSNIVGAFFNCVPSAGSLSRSSLQESSGGKTQVVRPGIKKSICLMKVESEWFGIFDY